MSLQARASEWDHRLYNVNRDLAHNFPFIAQEVAGRLEDGRWPFLVELAKANGVTMDDLGEVCQAACKFVVGTADAPAESMAAALIRSGWTEQKDAAQAAYCATVGAVVLGIWWQGAREATMKRDGSTVAAPCLAVPDLVAAGGRAADLCRLPRWRRWLLRARTRLASAVAAFRAKGG